MSFGYGVGDFLAILDLANQLRKRFVNAPSQFRSISDASKTLSNVLRDIEDIHLEAGFNEPQQKHLSEVSQGCRQALNELVDTLDKYQELDPGTKSRDGGYRRVWRRLKWDQADITEIQRRINASVNVFSLFINSLNSHAVFATNEAVGRIENTLEGQTEQAMIDWLTPVNYATQQSDFLSSRQEGTGNWLLNTENFRQWMDNDRQSLLCTGIPGAGKTILTSIVVDHLEKTFSDDRSVGIAYVYCNFRRHYEQKVQNVLASLVKQLVQGITPLPENIKALYTRHRKRDTRPTLDELSNTLHSIVGHFSRVFILVDALDEYIIADGSLSKLLAELFRVQTSHNICLFATSRHNPGIESAFEGCLLQEISAVAEDVRAFIKYRLSLLPSFISRNPELQAEIEEEVTQSVDGMFLLAHLHLGSLIGKWSPRAIRNALKQLPSGSDAYDMAYQEAMERIEGQVWGERKLANQVLAWITCARTPLTIMELQHALAVEIGKPELDTENLPDDQDMIVVCAGLVTVDKESHIIRLVHHTAQEYFERTQSQWFPRAQYQITTACLTYLSYDVFQTGRCSTDEEFQNRLDSYPLYTYSSRQWAYHTCLHPAEHKLILAFLQDQGKVAACYQAFMATPWLVIGRSQQDPTGVTGLHLAAYFGLETTITELLTKRIPCNVYDSTGQTPLYWAAKRGHEGVVKVLLDNGVDPNHQDRHGLTPLSRGAAYGLYELVRTLLENGAYPDLKDQSGQTPLFRAAENGHEAVVRLLLLQDVDKDVQDISGQTPLLCAAQYGHETVVKLLLDAGCDPHFKNPEFGWTALRWAADLGSEETVRLLLQSGVDVMDKDHEDRTPLSWAADHGHAAVMQLLLEYGADPDQRDGDGLTPLLRASYYGHRDAVDVLLENGADPNLGDSDDGLSPLLWAMERGRDAVVACLLQHGADPEFAEARFGRSCLMWAAIKSRESGDPLLPGTGFGYHDPRFGSTLGTEFWGNAKICSHLLAAGANPEARDNYGRTPLTWAAVDGHEEIARLLLQSADPNSADKFGRTPLLAAAAAGHAGMVRLLLEADGIDPSHRDVYGRDARYEAERRGHAEVSRVLSLDDVDTSMSGSASSLKDGHISCDICLLNIPKGQPHFHCGVCDGGDFDICRDCKDSGGSCLSGHECIDSI